MCVSWSLNKKTADFHVYLAENRQKKASIIKTRQSIGHPLGCVISVIEPAAGSIKCSH